MKTFRHIRLKVFCAQFFFDVIGWGIVPWMLIYMPGFFYIAGLNLIQHTVKPG
ncbi:MAG: hypothetical protein JW730_08480 [Anaerolineales bacterium]|nr:hypothetical protein [Anaerolineales bacterium]